MAFSVGTVGRFFGNTVAAAAGWAAGHATAPVLAPPLQVMKNNANSLYPHVPPPAVLLAEGVAQGQVSPSQAATWASQQGYDGTAFQAMIDIANTGPALGQAYEAWRRGFLSNAEFDTALGRLAIEQQWYPALRSLKDRLLDVTEIAKAVHRGIMRAPGLLVTAPPTTPGNVPIVPPSPLDPIAMAAGSGYNQELLRILVGNSGLPPGSGQMMELLNRGLITTDDFQRGVAESNLRNEWGPVLEQLAQYVLTPIEYANLHLRGYITHQQMLDGGALHGVSATDMDLLFQGQGRPITTHQIVTGEARGGVYNGPTSGIPPEYLAGLQESSIKPPWFNLDYANRYTYPGAFFFRLLLQTGALTQTQGEQAFLELGWDPKWAKLISSAIVNQAGGAKQDPHVAKAEQQLWTAIHKAFVKDGKTEAALDPFLAHVVPAQATRTQVWALWNYELSVVTLP